MVATERTRVEEKVLGVDLSQVDEAVLRETASEVFGAKSNGASPIPDVVRKLVIHFKEQAKAKGSVALMACEDCGGASPKDYDHCPFCGSKDEDEDEPASEVPAQNPKGSMVLAGVPASKALATEKDLDAVLGRIAEIRARTSHDLWRIGMELRTIYDNDLWKQRNDAKGKPAHKDFSSFVEAEVGLNIRSVFKLMGITREFEEPQLQKYGVTILKSLLAAPKEARAEIIEKIDSGAVKGKRGVEREVEQIRARAGTQIVEQSGKSKKTVAATKASAKKASAKREEAKKTVTVPFPAERISIDAFVRPASKKDPPKRAKRIGDRPWGKCELSNGVALYVSLVQTTTGELKFFVEARREG